MDKPDPAILSDKQAIHDMREYIECLELEILRLNGIAEELKVSLKECQDLLYH